MIDFYITFSLSSSFKTYYIWRYWDWQLKLTRLESFSCERFVTVTMDNLQNSKQSWLVDNFFFPNDFFSYINQSKHCKCCKRLKSNPLNGSLEFYNVKFIRTSQPLILRSERNNFYLESIDFFFESEPSIILSGYLFPSIG